jgi:cytoskeletal protein CcmA (bactofilin family)
MWRKPADAKTNPQSSNVPETISIAPKAGQTSSTAGTSSSAPAAAPSPIAQSATPPPAPNATPNSATHSTTQAATHGTSIPAAPRAISASLIGSGLKIQGEITGDSDLVIEGEAHGRIRMLNGRVTVAPNGRVNADIEAAEISVEGFVQGGLKATDRVRLGAASQVQGSVMTPRIAIEDGARLRGKVEMIRAGEVAAPAAKTAAGGAPVATTPATTTAAPTPNAATNTSKASDAVTPVSATAADRLKATAARGSGD